jgi:hypothetical protein
VLTAAIGLVQTTTFTNQPSFFTHVVTQSGAGTQTLTAGFFRQYTYEEVVAMLDPNTFADAVWAKVLGNAATAEANMLAAAAVIKDANIVQVNGQTINGTGTEANPWGP